MNDVTEASLIVTKGNRGRPRAAEPLTPVTIWITPSHYDRLVKLASLYDVKVSAFGRKAIERVIDRAYDTD